MSGTPCNLGALVLTSLLKEAPMKAPKAEDGRLNVRLPKEFLKRLKMECIKRDTTLQDAAKAALEAWLKEKVKP